MMKRLFAISALCAAGVVQSATPVTDAKLRGTSIVQSPGSLTVEAGATFAVQDTAAVTGLVRTPRFAVFVLPLGRGNSYDQQFCDFELKASQTNFGTAGTDSLVYFYNSALGGSGISHENWVFQYPDVYFTDSKNPGGNRVWRKQEHDISIMEQRASVNSVIAGIVVVVPVDDYVRPDNTKLVWSYQRVSPTGIEGYWQPVLPMWVYEKPAP